MAVNVSIKQKGLFKKNLNIKDIIHCTELRYGISDEHYRIIEEEIDDQILLYDYEFLSRGIALSIEGNDILLQLSLPTSIHEIECFYQIIEKISKYLNKVEIYRDEELYDFKLKDSYIDCDIDASMKAIDMISEQIEKGESEFFQILGVMQPLSIGKIEMNEIKGNLNKFGDWMHRLQSLDAYYAVPKVYKIREQITGIFAIGADIVSIVPTKPYIIMNQIEGIERWLVTLTAGKVISYDNFIEHVDKKYYDANHVVVELTDEKIMKLLEEFEEEL